MAALCRGSSPSTQHRVTAPHIHSCYTNQSRCSQQPDQILAGTVHLQTGACPLVQAPKYCCFFGKAALNTMGQHPFQKSCKGLHAGTSSFSSSLVSSPTLPSLLLLLLPRSDSNCPHIGTRQNKAFVGNEKRCGVEHSSPGLFPPQFGAGHKCHSTQNCCI